MRKWLLVNRLNFNRYQFILNMAYTNDTKPSMTVDYLVTEALDFLLTESGDFLITNQSTEYSNNNKNTNNWSNDSK